MSGRSLPDKLTLAPGASIVLDAPGQGTGGYLWTARVEEGAGRIEAEPVSAPPSDSVGAGVDARFRLTWSGTAGGSVVLQLKRPWESEPIRSHRIDIAVPGET